MGHRGTILWLVLYHILIGRRWLFFMCLGHSKIDILQFPVSRGSGIKMHLGNLDRVHGGTLGQLRCKGFQGVLELRWYGHMSPQTYVYLLHLG